MRSGGFSVEQRRADIAMRYKTMFGVDSARLWVGSDGKMFLILGVMLSTTENKTCQWYDGDGNPVHFDYLAERCVANGTSTLALYKSVMDYRKALQESGRPMRGRQALGL